MWVNGLINPESANTMIAATKNMTASCTTNISASSAGDFELCGRSRGSPSVTARRLVAGNRPFMAALVGGPPELQSPGSSRALTRWLDASPSHRRGRRGGRCHDRRDLGWHVATHLDRVA